MESCKYAVVAAIVVLGFAGIARAEDLAPPPVPPLLPDHATVVRLLSEQTGVDRRDFAVAFVMDVEARLCEGVTAKHSARAVFMWRVIERGRPVRRAGERTFHWNEDLGWFMYRVVTIRGGEAIDICSEHKGPIQVR